MIKVFHLPLKEGDARIVGVTIETIGIVGQLDIERWNLDVPVPLNHYITVQIKRNYRKKTQ